MRRVVACGLILVMSGVAVADDAALSGLSKPPPWFVDVADAVLAHHINPPARQQMILHGIVAVHEAAGLPVPTGLARRVSDLATAEQLRRLIEETWPKAPAKEKKGVTADMLAQAFAAGMFREVPRSPRLLSASEAKVAEQFVANLYVGIQIALGYSKDDGYSQVFDVFEGGPAQRAGVMKSDLMLAIDGKSMKGLSVTETVKDLRGAEGTDVTIQVRQPKSAVVRTYTLTRGRLMRPTLSGVRKRPSGGWDFRVDGSDPIGYVKVESIGGSTPHELRAVARQLESEGVRGLVIDLRTRDAALHPTLLLAAELLEGGTIGRERTADGVAVHKAGADALFRGWPIAVLTDVRTRGPAEWLAAALQDNHRALLVGAATAGDTEVESYVPVRGGEWAVAMTTRILERGDGRPIRDSRRSDPSQVLASAHLLRVAAEGMAPPKTNAPDERVVPDHKVESPAAVGPGPRRVRPAPPDLAHDPVMIKALELLREALRKAGSA